jgi:uncharacterized protein (DUF1778 family)
MAEKRRKAKIPKDLAPGVAVARAISSNTRPNARNRSEKVELRVSSREKDLLQEASRQLHQSLSAFVLASSIDRAKLLLADQTTFILTDQQWHSFVQALDQPVQPKPRLAELLRDPGYGE